jgi:hypothetical protein
LGFTIIHDDPYAQAAAQVAGGLLGQQNQWRDQQVSNQMQLDQTAKLGQMHNQQQVGYQSALQMMRNDRLAKTAASLREHPAYEKSPQLQAAAVMLENGMDPDHPGFARTLDALVGGAGTIAKIEGNKAVAETNAAAKNYATDAKADAEAAKLERQKSVDADKAEIQKRALELKAAYNTGRLTLQQFQFGWKKLQDEWNQAFKTKGQAIQQQRADATTRNAGQFERNQDLRLTKDQDMEWKMLQSKLQAAYNLNSSTKIAEAEQAINAFRQRVAGSKPTQLAASSRAPKPMAGAGPSQATTNDPTALPPGTHFQNDANSIGIVLPNGKKRAITVDDYNARVSRIVQANPGISEAEAMRLFNEQLQAETP